MPTLVRFLSSINRQILQKVVGNTYGVWAQELGFRRRGKQVPGSPRGERAGGGRECPRPRPHDLACDRRVHEAEPIKNVLYLSKVLMLNNSK